MERRLTTKVQNYQLDFKNAIKDWVDEQKATISSGDTDKTSDFLKFVFDFTNLTLSKEDFRKRKRTKNQVPQYERCTARRANGEQCTRRKREGSCFCGTHIKGTPHGIIDSAEEETKKTVKIEVWVQDIQGINYYIDAENNVYMPDDILSNSTAPRKIGKWTFVDGEYHIPNLGV
tara:strand:+ start:496 stop:1020 length:525 start_codon:yes stop_codon:yes gene_type:complete